MSIQKTDNFAGTGPSQASSASDEPSRSTQTSTPEKAGKSNGHSFKSLLSSGFQRIKTIVDTFLKTLDMLSSFESSLSDRKAAKMTKPYNQHMQKLNTLRANALLKNTGRFVQGDQSELISTLKNRRPGEGITAAIEKNRPAPQGVGDNPKALAKAAERKKTLARAISVQQALGDAHTVIDSLKELQQLQKAARKNPDIVASGDLERINQRIEELKPLAGAVKNALSSPNYRNLFERLFIPN